MDRSRWLLVAALALAILGVWALALSVVGRLDAQPSVTGAAGVPTSGLIATPRPSVSSPATERPASPTIAPTADASASPMPTPTPTARPTVAPTEAAGDPRLRFVEFQLRLADAGDDVQALNESLVDAAQAQDDGATVVAAVAMLDFVDRERDWLAAHPPAACYADAHAAAGSMLREYGAVAEAAIEYADATGLERLEALAALLEQVEVAGDALRTLGASLEVATCLA